MTIMKVFRRRSKKEEPPPTPQAPVPRDAPSSVPRGRGDEFPDKDLLYGRYYEGETEALRHRKANNRLAEKIAHKATDTPEDGEGEMNVNANKTHTETHNHQGVGLLGMLGVAGLAAGLPTAGLLLMSLLNKAPEPAIQPVPNLEGNVTEYQFQTLPGGSMPWPEE